MSIVIKVEEIPDAATRQLIDHGLDEYNVARAGPDNAEDLWVIARDDEGVVTGGVKARTFYAWMFVDWLWVSKAVRGAGVGMKLMDKAEAVARQRGCVGAYVDTFSFQAPGFYQTRGYEEFGRIDGFPVGHACIWLRKSFLGPQRHGEEQATPLRSKTSPS